MDNVIGRATIDYGLKEAYQPSNVVLDIWFLGGRQLLQTGEENLSNYRQTMQRSPVSLGGHTVASLGDRETNLVLL